MSDETEAEAEAVAAAEAAAEDIKAMNKLHVDIGRKAAQVALELLESEKFKTEMTPAAAVSLLRFGVELERKALLGVEEDGGSGPDPFDALANALTQTTKDG